MYKEKGRKKNTKRKTTKLPFTFKEKKPNTIIDPLLSGPTNALKLFL